MGKPTFHFICYLLALTTPFQPKGTGQPQAAVDVQFATYLWFFGSSSHNCHFDAARDTSIAVVSVRNHVLRVISGLQEMELRFLKWPSAAHREVIMKGFGLSGYIGAVDGSLIPLSFVPKE
ncbi:hypothetical protein BT69DRAFT_1233877 [Atractiella rhizophila]|nr:hypothetical protein BT69DRAFT_1233877 [Atractiella rhizophila]